MKKLVLLLTCVMVSFTINAQQTKNPVSFTYKTVKNSNGTIDVIATATIDLKIQTKAVLYLQNFLLK